MIKSSDINFTLPHSVLAYKGTVVAYDQPVGGPTVLELENVFYKVMEP